MKLVPKLLNDSLKSTCEVLERQQSFLDAEEKLRIERMATIESLIAEKNELEEALFILNKGSNDGNEEKT